MSLLKTFAQKKRITTTASPIGKTKTTGAAAPLPLPVKATTKEVIDIESTVPDDAPELLSTPPAKSTPTASPPHATRSANKRKSTNTKPDASTASVETAAPATSTATATPNKLRSSPALKKLKLSPPQAVASEPQIDASGPIVLPPNPREGVLPRYWEGVSDAEILLRKFDLDVRFGPAMGVTRKERWTRANGYGLNPPLYIWQLLTQSTQSTQSAAAKPKRGAAKPTANAAVEQESLWDRSLK